MNLVDLKTKLVMNELPDLMIFTGEETGVMEIYIQQIINKLNLPVSKASSVADIFKLCSGNSFFKSKKLFIVSDDLDFIKNGSGWDNIKKLNNKIILRYHNYDSRLGFWKKFEQETVVFERMNLNVLVNHLSKEFNLPVHYTTILAQNCDCDYIRCKIELNKVICYSKAKGISLEDAFRICLNDGVLCLDTNSTIDDFINSVVTRNYNKMFQLYSILEKQGIAALKILNFLYNSFKGILVAQTIHSARNVQQNTGINYYQYMKSKELSGHYTNEHIEDILYRIMQVEQGIKSGTISETISVDYLLTFL